MLVLVLLIGLVVAGTGAVEVVVGAAPLVKVTAETDVICVGVEVEVV